MLLTLPALLGFIALASNQSPLLAGSKAVGSIHGTVTYRGKVPKESYPDDLGRRRPLLQVDDETQGLQYAVVYLRPADDNGTAARNEEAPGDNASSKNRQESKPSADTRPVVVDQRDMAFAPHLIAVRAGQTVEFTNSDAANHNVRSTSLDRRNQFNVLTPSDGSYQRAFVADPKQRPIRLGCEIHAWMRAWIYVFDHPSFSVTDAKGNYAIADVPPGDYRLELRQPDGGLQATRAVHVATGEPRTVGFQFTEEDLSLSR